MMGTGVLDVRIDIDCPWSAMRTSRAGKRLKKGSRYEISKRLVVEGCVEIKT